MQLCAALGMCRGVRARGCEAVAGAVAEGLAWVACQQVSVRDAERKLWRNRQR